MNIYQKMMEVMKGVTYLSKDDKVEFKTTKYKAISEEKVTSTVRAKLIEQGLVIFPIAQSHKRQDMLTTVDVTYRIVNTENPDEYVDVVSSGTGVDTQDKGVGKAMTYAYKYMLLRTFAIPTGEDPDKGYAEEMRRFAALCGLTIDSRLKAGTVKANKQQEEIENRFGAI